MDLMTLLFIVLAFVIGLVIGGGFMFYLKNKHIERALWVLYLLRLLLQTSMLRLRQEQTRSAQLVKAYKKLDEHYRDFCGKVQSNAKQRVVKRAFSAFASLVPGLGLVDLVICLGDILDIATAADEIADSLTNAVASLTLPEVPHVGKVLLAVRENALSPVIERLEELDLEALDKETLSACVKEAVQGLENLIESMSAAERREAIEKVVDEFKELGIAYYDYRKMLNFLKKESSSGSTNSTLPQ